MKTPHLLIFNLDGTIIDTNDSISSAIRRTVQNYFSHFLGIHGSGSLVSQQIVHQFWQAGADDPQELSASLIGYLLSLLPEKFYPARPPRTVYEASAFLKKTSQSIQHLSTSYLQKKADFGQLLQQIEEAGGGRKAFQQVMRRYLKHPLLLHQGHIEESNLVGRLYIEFYLGYKNCYRVERVRPRFYRKAGLIESETLLINHQQLQQIRRVYRRRMAVITTRKLPNAKLMMQQFQIEHYFDAIITYEDVVAEQSRRRRLRQRSPITQPLAFMLLEAIERLTKESTQPALYIGSQPRDTEAAQQVSHNSQHPVSSWLLNSNPATPAAQHFNDTQALVKALVND